MTEGNKIHLTPADEALYRFDAENNVEPPRIVAMRIAQKHGVRTTSSLVDDITHAIEDALELGQKRGKLL